MKKYKYFRADPAGNITGFVLGNVAEKDRPIISNKIMEDIDTSVEQVAFISKDKDENFRMDMMGGEFCGNASRSFGLFMGKILDLEGINNLKLDVSGLDYPASVQIDMDHQRAKIVLEPAKNVEDIRYFDKAYKTVFLPGIVHIIVDDVLEDPDLARRLTESLEDRYKEDAYGVMFYDREKSFMIPYVYVPETGSFVREGSCGSGTIALGYYLNLNGNKDFYKEVKQPGGTISLEALEIDEKVLYSIGGRVDFGPMEEIELNI